MKKVCLFCAETVKENVQLLLSIFFHVEDCVAAPSCISLFFKERAAASERYQWTTASERKCAADIFLCVAASRNISMFFKGRIHCEIFLSRHFMKY